MKKLLILTASIIIAVSTWAQTETQEQSYNGSMQFLTDTYATITDISYPEGYMSVYADMPLGYTDYLIKLDMKNFADTYENVRIYSPWTYDKELNAIRCTLLISEVEQVVVVYSEEINTIFFFFEWK